MIVEDFVCKLNDDNIPWRLFTPRKSTKEYCVLWLSGFSSAMDSHREAVVRTAQQSGLAFATCDPAGHGLHKLPLADSSRKQQNDEITAIFDEVKKRGYENIIVVGGSFGGYMAALLTARRPVHAVILRAPANYTDDEYELPYKQTLRSNDYAAYAKTKESDRMLHDSSATKAIKAYDGFVYVLEHELDEVIPSKVPQHYFKVAKMGNYLIIPKTKHTPKTLKNPWPHYEYIEHITVSILQAIRMQNNLSGE